MEKQKEIYIERACSDALGHAATETDTSESFRFWQSLSTSERMAANWEITKRVHLAKGGTVADLILKKSVGGLRRWPDDKR